MTVVVVETDQAATQFNKDMSRQSITQKASDPNSIPYLKVDEKRMNTMCHEATKKTKDKGENELVPQLAFGCPILRIADPENDTSPDYLIADQAAAAAVAADSWTLNHCSADAANYYVAESAEDWLAVVAAAEFAVMASRERVSSLELVSSKLMS